MSPSCYAVSKAFEISKNAVLTSRGALQSMMQASAFEMCDHTNMPDMPKTLEMC